VFAVSLSNTIGVGVERIKEWILGTLIVFFTRINILK